MAVSSIKPVKIKIKWRAGVEDEKQAGNYFKISAEMTHLRLKRVSRKCLMVVFSYSKGNSSFLKFESFIWFVMWRMVDVVSFEYFNTSFVAMCFANSAFLCCTGSVFYSFDSPPLKLFLFKLMFILPAMRDVRSLRAAFLMMIVMNV